MALIGVNVRKRTLDVAWLRDRETLKAKTRSFDNDRTGIQRLLGWLARQTGRPVEQLQIMMAASKYHEALAHKAHAAGAEVFVADPEQAKQFADALPSGWNTAHKNSVTLARFLASRQHQPWQPEPTETRRLRALLRRLEELERDIQREHNRYEWAEAKDAAEDVFISIDTVGAALRQERNRLIKEINDHVDQHDHLRRNPDMLDAVPGVGGVMSADLLAMLKSPTFLSAPMAGFGGSDRRL